MIGELVFLGVFLSPFLTMAAFAWRKEARKWRR